MLEQTALKNLSFTAFEIQYRPFTASFQFWQQRNLKIVADKRVYPPGGILGKKWNNLDMGYEEVGQREGSYRRERGGLRGGGVETVDDDREAIVLVHATELHLQFISMLIVHFQFLFNLTLLYAFLQNIA